MPDILTGRLAPGVALAAMLGLTACGGFDLDMRDRAGNTLDTTGAVETRTAPRPEPDARGVISYPQFQVAIARRGDTVASVAARIGTDAEALAAHNGLTVDTRLRRGEVLALPSQVAGGSTPAGTASPGGVDITTLAGDAIDRADADSGSGAGTAAGEVQKGPVPVQHRVVRGETAYSISRLYGVSVRALAEWNGLGPDLTVREGQYLLIPVADSSARGGGSDGEVDVVSPAPVEETTTAPGEGSPTPTPPSASQPLPDDDTRVTEETRTPASPDLEEERTEVSATARLIMPVSGSIIRGYTKGSNEGIDIAAPAGTPVKAAGSGTVAAITRDTDQVPILVIRHSGNLLTVYANISDITVAKGDRVGRGQVIAKVRGGDSSFLHFEVREGFDSVDPVAYLN